MIFPRRPTRAVLAIGHVVVCLISLAPSAVATSNAFKAHDAARANRLTAYLAQRFPSQIEQVTADATHIRITGRVAEGDAQLAEIGMWRDVVILDGVESIAPLERTQQGQFTATVDRLAPDGRDRLCSAWAFVRRAGERYELLSALHYADDVAPRAPELPPARPKSKKGLCGCPFAHADIAELGVASATLNLVLSRLVFAEAAPGRTPFHHGGRTWYANDRLVAGYDADLRAAAKQNVMVSAILLIAPPRDAAPGSWAREAAHPDADPAAAYVMPNFTARTGVEAYAAAVDFLAERYTRPDGQFGRIHHWIVHNEVNSGFHWTSAGEKKPLTYLDLYQRSLRLVHLTARQYDPSAKAFVSLDHWWTRNPDPRGYAGRELLEHLLAFSRVEGDFDWGIAVHPYAEDLGNPRTWEDPGVTFWFDTPLITFRNIEVLDAWARKPEVAFRGKTPREIHLTEQGLNARGYDERSLREQAAGLAYAWAKIEPLTTVTAFQYHRWDDHRGEGGLRLGLRKFADEPGDPRGKKPAWEVFRAMGTDQWEAAAAFAKPIVGVKEWREVRYAGEIK